jgi:prepilin-type N-terminal cleavage/methylation domain-containing protein
MKGFTLIELLVVIGIIVILMTAALIAINPFKQFAMANNASRWSGVTTMMNAISQRMVDGRGAFKCTPTGAVITDCPATGDTVPTTATNIANSGGYNICDCLVDEYVATMPYDPQTGSYTSCTTYDSQYSISCSTANGRITISAPDAQLSETILITR